MENNKYKCTIRENKAMGIWELEILVKENGEIQTEYHATENDAILAAQFLCKD